MNGSTRLVFGVGLIALTACGRPSAVYVLDITPVDGSGISSEIDSFQSGRCFSADGEGCIPEPFTAHYADVRVSNDKLADPENPFFGREMITSYTLVFRGVEGAPPLGGTEGVLNVIIDPQTTTPFRVLMAGLDLKRQFGSGPPVQYQANYTFQGPDGLSLEAGVSVLVGDFNACPNGGSLGCIPAPP